jgi:AsmA protein
MTGKRKKVLMVVGVAVSLIITLVLITLLLLDINSFKSRIETTASGMTGLDVSIRGKMRLSFFPFGLSAKDMRFANKGVEILSLERLKLGTELIPLLKKQLNVTSCELVKPNVIIMKDADGRYNFESTEKKSAKGWSATTLRLNDLKVSRGTFAYLDKGTGEKTELNDINLVIKDLSIGDTLGDIIKNASFTGTMNCRELRKKDLKIDNIKSGIQAEKGIFSLKPLTMDIFGAKGEGDVTADKTKTNSEYEVNLNVSKLDLEKLQESFAVERLLGGKGDLVVSLTVLEKEGLNLIKGVNGTLSLRGDTLITYTMDLDEVLSSYEASQKFSLVDVGAFFIAGPLGTAALKGYRYGDVYYQTQGGRGTITQFVSQWKVKGGVAEATDCALATKRHRVALKGKLNLVSERYENVTVALLDDKGCVQLKQSISGSFGAPQVGAVSAVVSLADPILHLYRKAKRFVQGGKCEVFYSGAVEQPR